MSQTWRPWARCSRAPGCSIWDWSGRVGAPGGRSSEMTSAGGFSPSASPGPTSMPTSATSTSGFSPMSTSSPVAFRAPQRQRPGSVLAEPTSAGSGPSTPAPFAIFDRATSSWRMSQDSWLPTETEQPDDGTGHSSRTSLVIWPRSGTWGSGTAFPRLPLVPLTSAIASGSWLPTPVVAQHPYNQSRSPGAARRPSLYGMARHGLWPTPKSSDHRTGLPGRAVHPRRRNLNDAAARWPTPLARDARSCRGAARTPSSQGSEPLVTAVGGRLNPTWVEWLMGAPLGWTDPDCELSATELSRRSRCSSADGSSPKRG